MKKKESKYGLLKAVLIILVLAFILSWIIPSGAYTTNGYSELGVLRLGIYDIASSIYYAVSFGLDKIVLLFAIGAFYGVATRTKAYERIVSGIARKLNKKVAVVLFSVILAVLTSLLTQTFAVLIFVPFIISILNRMKLDKMTILATTFGSILVGIMGATYGTDGVNMFNYYLGYTTETPNVMPALWVRAGILGIGLVLFNFFTLIHMGKVEKKAESIDLFEVEVEDEVVQKRKNMIPIIVIGVVLFVLVILGFVNWKANFGIEIFDDFHQLVTEDIRIEGSSESADDFFILRDIIGYRAGAFGEWDNVLISSVLIIFTLVLAVCYRVKLNELFESIRKGIKKFIVPSLCIVGAYALMILAYHPSYSQSSYIATIVNRLLTLTDGFNIATMTLSSLILNIFHTDLGFTGYVFGSLNTGGNFLVTEYADYINPVYTMFTSLYGFVQFFIPTSMILGIGLVSLKVNYKDWLKYIWRFLVGMFICLLIIFILMSIL